MKKKGLFTAIIAALVAFTCAFAIACGRIKIRPDREAARSRKPRARRAYRFA
ncbi:MAG: hypothetical protein ACLUSP_06185 [Christensenellales bacterium]